LAASYKSFGKKCLDKANKILDEIPKRENLDESTIIKNLDQIYEGLECLLEVLK